MDGVRAAGGLWTLDDLAQYRVVEREPLVFQHRGKTVITAPPPSSGGIALAQTLQILDGYDWSKRSELDRLHLRIEAMRRACRARAVFLGDPDFVDAPVALLTNPAYAAGLRAGIHPEKATPSAMLPGVTALERPDTTHFSIVDADGNIASVTQTVNLPYGNAMVIPGTGFLLNNEMDDFSVKAGVPNAFGLVGGTPGGSRIISMVIQGVLALDAGASALEAAAEPRVHHQYLPDEVSIEKDALSPELRAGLEARGHVIKEEPRTWGNMQVVTWDLTDGDVDAGADPRWKSVGKGSTQDGGIFR